MSLKPSRRLNAPELLRLTRAPSEQLPRSIANIAIRSETSTRRKLGRYVNWLAILLAACVFLIALPAKGADPVDPDEPPITHVREGEPAPFDGDLFPPIKALRLGLRVEHCDERTAAELARATRILEVEIQRERDKAQAAIDAERMRRELAEAQLEVYSAWYRSPEFVTIIAIVGAVSLVIGTAALADAVLGR